MKKKYDNMPPEVVILFICVFLTKLFLKAAGYNISFIVLFLLYGALILIIKGITKLANHRTELMTNIINNNSHLENINFNNPHNLTIKNARIGGWLYLVGISLIISPFLIFQTLYSNMLMLTPELWNFLTNSTSEGYHPFTKSLIITEMLGNIVYFIGSLILLIIFLLRKKSFPLFWIILMCFSLIFVLFDEMAVNAIYSSIDDSYVTSFEVTIRTFISCLVWIPYALKSKRIKYTFVK